MNRPSPRALSWLLLACLAGLAVAPSRVRADPNKDESGNGRRETGDRKEDRERRGRDGGDDREAPRGGSEMRKDLDERDRELRQAAAERDRELEHAAAEADREDKPEKYEEKSGAIWAKYDEKRERVLARFEDKHGAAADDPRPSPRGDGGLNRRGERARDGSKEDPRERGRPRGGADEFRRDERRDNLLKKVDAVEREINQEHDRHEARMADLRRTRDVRTERGRDGAAQRATAAIREENTRHTKRLADLDARRDELRSAVDAREKELRSKPGR